ncbi:MAG: cation transporter [Bacteroidetes bacterium HGW-Bacteroidetes-14]|jgi:cobalt-zinc-cadmium efflux system protein|nr:MAG: cation transporter [Bacteroidetes bacterium HGW-Bacteroidetes-14]
MEISNKNQNSKSSGNIVTAFALNLIFALIELAGGLYTNSVAILSDAIHDFGDSLSLGVAFYLQKKSERKGDNKYTYGYKRFSLLGSLFISVVLIVSSVFIIRESIVRLITPQEADATGMLILAVLGIIVNGAAVFKLKKGTSYNEKAVTLHMMEDLLGWTAVLAGSIIMMFADVPFIDPVMSLLITVWVLYNVYRNLRETMRIMLQEVPEQIDILEIERKIKAANGVKSVHDLHIWSLDGENHIVTFHIVTDENVTPADISDLKENIREMLFNEGINHVTIETETKEDNINCIKGDNCR